MFKRFENFTEAFPKQDPEQPPQGIIAFVVTIAEALKNHCL